MKFLRDLAANNRREWFEAHRETYESALRSPMRFLVEEMDVRLATFAPEIVGNPKRSMFRIHRDIRFSKDKSPYKTNAACWFFHRGAGKQVGAGSGPDGGAAGFYFHLSPKSNFVGGGIWMPPRPQLQVIRAGIAERHREFERALGRARRAGFAALDGEGKLTRVPRGFDADDPAADWLRHSSFTTSFDMSTKEVLSPDLPKTLERAFRALTPFVRWLNETLGYPSAKAR